MHGAHRIELVGVTGTGKSTLARTLLAGQPDWHAADFVHARDPSHWRYFAHCAPGAARLLPGALQRPRMSWDELKLYVYASEWHRYLAARREHRSGVTLFDQGPIFALARLVWGGSAVTKGSWFRSWKRETVACWARELDLVVELTAPDDVVLARVDARDRWHEIKGLARRGALEVVAAHRRAYADVLEDVERSGPLRLLRVDTSARPPEAIADELAGFLSPGPAKALDGTVSDAQRATGVTRAGMRDGIEELGSIG